MSEKRCRALFYTGHSEWDSGDVWREQMECQLSKGHDGPCGLDGERRGRFKEWKQERPDWCPHPTCLFKRRVQDAMCCGDLPEPAPHDGDENIYRICLNGAADNGGVFDLQVNDTDLGYFRWIFDALDGKATSWLSRRMQEPAP